MRERIYEMVEKPAEEDSLSRFYDIFMLIVIVISIIPLCFKFNNQLFNLIDYTTCAIFIVDYIFRISTADYKLHEGKMSFILYPFTPFAIIDLISILPTISIISHSFKLFRLFRVFKTFRLFKSLRYSRNFEFISTVIKNEKEPLISILVFAVVYTFISALIMFNVEPGNFDNFFDAFYWATTALTTVGYGDIYPVTEVGKIVSILSSCLGIAIIALPSGILTAGFMSEIERRKDDLE